MNVKKYLTTLLLALFSYLSAMAAVSLEAAKTKVRNYAANTLKLGVYDLYSNTSGITKVEIVFGNSISVPASNWVFFLDEQPKANWEHNASVIFVSKIDGVMSRVRVKFTPKDFGKWVKDSNTLTNGIDDENAFAPSYLSFDNNGLLLPNQFAKSGRVSNNSYALIISGGADQYNNHSRYWNDCSMFYQLLVNVYGYNRNNIYVLMSDGTSSAADLHLSVNNKYISSPLDLDGDGKADIQRSATAQNISWAFDQLASRMTDNDNLFIFTTDHGSSNGNLCLWGEQYSPTQMVTQVRKLKHYKSISVCMEQCYSGAFVSPLSDIDRLTITTAATASETSCGSKYIDPYVYYWAMAMGKKVTADTDKDLNISMLEAYNYAKQNDECFEHPQFWSNECDGERLYLDGPLVENLALSGSMSSNTIKKATTRITSTASITKANVEYQSYGDIKLKAGFKTSGGANFKSIILPCSSSNVYGSLRSGIADEGEYIFEYISDPDPTDIDDVVSEFRSLKVYPNPTTGEITISFGEASEDGNSVIISDMMGKVVYSANNLGSEASINLNDKANGIYVIKAVINGNVFTEKLILK